MRTILVRKEAERAAYRLPFHVRVPAEASTDLLERQVTWSLERMRAELEKQGWGFVALSPERPRGPLPVVPVKGVGKRPPKGPRTPLQADDSLWRVSTLPQTLTDEVEWEYIAVFARPTITTVSEAPEDHA